MSTTSPILNNPYLEPQYHYATDAEGSLNYLDIREGRRIFTPDIQVIPQGHGELYIENDTLPSAHQKVNVYMKPGKLYEIRQDEFAIDVFKNEALRK